MKVEIVDPRRMPEEMRERWLGLQRQDPTADSPFLSPGFAAIAADVRPGVEVAVLSEGGEALAFLPFERHGAVGRPVGAWLSDRQGVVAAPGVRLDAAALLRAAGLLVYDFTAVHADQPAFRAHHASTAVSYAIDLGRGFDGYARARRAEGSEAVGQTEARARRLGRAHGPVRFAMHDPDPAVLERLIAWKRAQYRATGVLDALAFPWARDLLRRVHAARSEGFAGVLSTLSVGSSVVAAHLGMRTASTLHYWFPAYDRDFAPFSPGLVLLLRMCQAEAGIRTIDLGKGDLVYQRRFASGTLPVAAGFVSESPVASWSRRARHRLVSASAALPAGRAAHWPRKLFNALDRIRFG
jgi:CelD/BcsL family acetyltransferase involved in cellulose biosynthesis